MEVRGKFLAKNAKKVFGQVLPTTPCPGEGLKKKTLILF